MANQDHIRNPIEWTADQIKAAGLAVGHAGHALRSHEEGDGWDLPAVRRISVADLGECSPRAWMISGLTGPT